MAQNASYYWTQVQVNPCQNHFTCDVIHSTLYQNLPQETQRILFGNGQFVSVLFIILVVVDIHGHRFEIYTLVSEIHENVDLVLGINNVFKLEGIINSRNCCFTFLNRSVPIYPENEIALKPNEQKLVKVKAPFADKISGMVIIKILDGSTHSTLLIKLKFRCNKAVLDIESEQRRGYYDI